MKPSQTNYFVHGSKIHFPSRNNDTINTRYVLNTPQFYKYYPYEVSFSSDRSLEQSQEDPETGRRRYFFPPSFTN